MSIFDWSAVTRDQENVVGSRLADAIRGRVGTSLDGYNFEAAKDAAMVEMLGTTTEVFNVRGFGAQGNGTTDDTAAIQAAIDAAAGGGSVFLPEGVYRVSDTLAIGDDRLHLWGEGPRRTTINYVGAADAITVSLSSTTRSVYIADFSLRGVSGAPTGHGLSLTNLNRAWTIERVEVRGFTATGKAAIYLKDCLGGEIRHVKLGSNDSIDGEVANGLMLVDQSDVNSLIGVAVYAAREVGILIGEGPDEGVPDGNVLLAPFIYDGSLQAGTEDDCVGIKIQGNRTLLLNPWLEGCATGILTATHSGGSPNRLTIIGGDFNNPEGTDVDLPTGTDITLIGVRAADDISIGAGATRPLLLGCTTPTTLASVTAGMVRATDEGISADRGDDDVTLVSGTDVYVQRFATELTQNRTVTLSSTNAVRGARFRVVRTGLGAFTLDVGGLKTIASGTAAFVEAMHDGTAWRLVGYGEL